METNFENKKDTRKLVLKNIIKLNILINVSSTILKIFYVNKTRRVYVNFVAKRGIHKICLCAVEYSKQDIELECNSDCYFSYDTISEIIKNDKKILCMDLTVDGKYWFNAVKFAPSILTEQNTLHYIKFGDPWISNLTSTCKCLMKNELDAVVKIVGSLLNTGYLINRHIDTFCETLRRSLFKKYYEHWYERNYERKLIWDPTIKKASNELLDALCVLEEINAEVKQQFDGNFVIYFGPGNVELKHNDKPSVYVDTERTWL